MHSRPIECECAMSLFSGRSAETNPLNEPLLDRAFETACHKLREIHHIEIPALALMIDPLALAISTTSMRVKEI